VIPTTSQPSSGMFAKIFQTLAASGEDIFSVNISTGLSGTLEAARMGMEHAPEANVTLFDSMTLSGAERFQVLAASMAAKMGWSAPAIVERLKEVRAATEIAYTLETLTYLARGGRIGRVAALAAAVLKLKPVITVDKVDGKYSTVGKSRTISGALTRITEYITQAYGATQPLWMTVLHGQFQEQAENLRRSLQQNLNVSKMEILRISPVLGVHTGPGIVGVAAVPIEVFDGLL
jgi:DegV family protein with EDD domain